MFGTGDPPAPHAQLLDHPQVFIRYFNPPEDVILPYCKARTDDQPLRDLCQKAKALAVAGSSGKGPTKCVLSNDEFFAVVRCFKPNRSVGVISGSSDVNPYTCTAQIVMNRTVN
jgi:hypothetical protein